MKEGKTMTRTNHKPRKNFDWLDSCCGCGNYADQKCDCGL